MVAREIGAVAAECDTRASVLRTRAEGATARAKADSLPGMTERKARAKTDSLPGMMERKAMAKADTR
jgi:hypothetical protein